MNKQIKTYEIGEQVWIIGAHVYGYILAIYFTLGAPLYRVAYWVEAIRYEEDLIPQEIRDRE